MRSSTDFVVMAELRCRLFTGRLRPGSAVNIADMADDLRVSTAPVRDALMRLSERGLITRIEGRGFFVAITPDHEAAELLGILHQIISVSIERGRHTLGLNRTGEKSNGSAAAIEQNAHDKLNAMLEQICSPTVAAIAISVADRLWDVRRRIAEQNGSLCQEVRLIEIIRKSVIRSKKKRALRVLNSSHMYCQNFLMSQISAK